MKRKTRQKPPSSHLSSPDCAAILLAAFCAMIVLIHMIASFFPKGRIWGFNHWSYFPLWIGLPLGVSALLLLVPQINRLARGVLHSLSSSFLDLFHLAKAATLRRRYIWYAMLSLLFFLPFWFLRDRAHLLGDGAQIISRMASGELSVKWTEPLEIFLHLKAYGLAQQLWGMHSATVYALLSCLVGILFVFLLFLFADLWGERRGEKILIFLVVMGMGSSQLFFGYVEHYSFLYLFTFAFIFCSIFYLEGKLSWLFPAAAFVLAFLSHVSASHLLPSLLFLLFIKGKEGRLFRVRRVLILAFGTLTLVAIAVLYNKHSWAVPPMLVPLSEDTYSAPGYLLFSLPHLADFVNQQLLASPVGPIMVLAPLACFALKPVLKSTVFQFLLLVSASQLFFNFVVDPNLGAPRDWDLFSTVGLGYTVLGLLVFLRLLKNSFMSAYLIMILVVASLYSTLPWIAIHASEARSIRRFENILEIDAKRSYSGHFVLIRYFESRGMDVQAQRRTEKYREAFPELVLISDASRLAKDGQLDEAEKIFLQAERLAPKLSQVHNNLGKVYLDRGELEKAEAQLKEAVRLSSFLAAPYVNLADLYLLRQQYDLALDACEKAIRLKTDYPQTYSNAATIHLMKGNLRQAEDRYRKALSLDPKFADPYVGLGDIYNRWSMPERAVSMYQEALRLNPYLAKARFRLGMTYLSLNARKEAREQLELYLEILPTGKDSESARQALEKLSQQGR